ncbi:hypothetical protein EfmAA96_30570 (plasmid) [Enterococcus faecium]|nr:hypothetical protein EfmAA96_30570 [Enterococcus faecium]
MTYTHLTPNELVMIETYFHQETPVAIVAKQLKRGRQTIYNVYNFLKCGGTALEYFEQYKENKRRCGRTEIIFPAEEKEYIAKRSTEGWTPDVIIGRAERTFSCSVSTLYRRFKTGEFNVLHLPMQGKRKPNEQHLNTLNNTKKISDVVGEPKSFFLLEEFGPLQGDTIVGIHHKSAVITLVERLSKAIIPSIAGLRRENSMFYIYRCKENENQMVIRKNVENRHSKEIFLNVKRLCRFRLIFISQTQERLPNGD